MALPTLVSTLNAKRRALNFPNISPEVQRQLKTFFETLGQLKGNPDLAIVEFDELSDTDVVIADAACKLYGLYLQKDSSTATFTKLTDDASTSSDTAADFVLKSPATGAAALPTDRFVAFPSGFALANGATMQGNTTADAGTGSASNGEKGFAIIGNA
jgi:uncharacterized protein YuzB (UPF0349 family)